MAGIQIWVQPRHVLAPTGPKRAPILETWGASPVSPPSWETDERPSFVILGCAGRCHCCCDLCSSSRSSSWALPRAPVVDIVAMWRISLRTRSTARVIRLGARMSSDTVPVIDGGSCPGSDRTSAIWTLYSTSRMGCSSLIRGKSSPSANTYH